MRLGDNENNNGKHGGVLTQLCESRLYSICSSQREERLRQLMQLSHRCHQSTAPLSLSPLSPSASRPTVGLKITDHTDRQVSQHSCSSCHSPKLAWKMSVLESLRLSTRVLWIKTICDMQIQQTAASATVTENSGVRIFLFFIEERAR